MKLIAWVVAACSGLISTSLAAEPSFHIAGNVPTPGDWTAARLTHELGPAFRQVDYTLKGKPHVAYAVALVIVLKASGLDLSLKMKSGTDPKLKNRVLRLAVVIRSSDGYTATMSVGELLPEIGNRHVWLATDTDGQPLPPGTAANLIAPDDLLPGRWVRNVSEIDVVDPSERSTTQPAR